MSFLQILILGLVQGAAELLPVSSSAHVIVAEKLMRLDPSSPEMTFLLVMLHTGTMFAVIVYFWNSWLDHYCSDASHLGGAIKNILAATAVTVIVGFILKLIIEKVFMHGQAKAEVEELFSNLPLIGGALLAAGVLIIYSGSSEEKRPGAGGISVMGALVIGAMQGLCLPFRGFSRSGGTISAGLLIGIERRRIEEFSFALAVVLTPIVVVMEFWRLIKAHPEIAHGSALAKLLTPGLLGMVCSFVAGYLALKLLSRLLEAGRWKYFGYYCLLASAVVFGLAYTEKANASSTAVYTSPTTVSSAIPESTTVLTNAAPAKEAPLPVMDAGSPATMMPASTPATNIAPAVPATNAPGQ
ncbi:MAG TPA: undecaprenyl-diphosphate phosphatase [Candidatus Methylacidiphilales bacterium]|jgi:undecaprenyl-diphosphatase|nr:undecaprenyl-diphosphate phosphatase [Candidatus Methylacidiphilales bacterium]